MATEVTAKRWGNSMGILLPKKLILKQHIKENDKILIEVVKEANLSNVFGSLKRGKISGQKFKDIAREGWQK